MAKKANLDEKGLLNVKQDPGTGLSGRFIMSPFSILRAESGPWLVRKQQWLLLGIREELKTTDGGVFATVRTQKKSMFTERIMAIGWQSVFDPVLCELMYSWFCPEGGQIVDPFAGGSVRGIVAAYMDYQYWGAEIRKEQVMDNRLQAQEIIPTNPPKWVAGDSFRMLNHAPEADFIFSCPPYGNLEVYSTNEGDLSNMPDEEFDEKYVKIIALACGKLKENRFACFVVGNYRDKKGFFRDLAGLTIDAFEAAGVRYYNEAVLMNATGTLCIRAGRQFASGRKLGRHHQNVLIFYKGDPKMIKEIFV